MGRLIITNAMTLNGAFEAPEPEPGKWLVLDPDTQGASLDQWLTAEAMVVGRRTYEGLAAVWPQMADLPGFEIYAARMNSMPKYVASRTLSEPLEWNATLLDGDLTDSVTAIKEKHQGDLVVTGAGELTSELIARELVDEMSFWVSPYLWPEGPRIFDRLGAIRLDLVSSTSYPSGVVHLRYRPAPAGPPAPEAAF
jgi:dihydrofolate reductase